MKTNSIIKIALSISLFVFIGCGEDKAKTKELVESAEQAVAPIIEVVKNENPNEIKVAVKKQRDRNLTGDDDKYYYDYNVEGVKSAYDPNSLPANKDAKVRVKPRTTIDANMNIRSPYEEIKISLLVGKLSKNFIVKCSACHSDYANGVIGPSLLGKSADEIFSDIAAFKSGEKSNVLMDDLIHMMSTDEIKVIAAEIYEFNQKIKEARK